MPSVAVADIGGTNCRLAVFDTYPSLSLKSQRIVPTTGVENADALWEMLQALCGSSLPQAVCIALAGPVADGIGKLTNGQLCLDQKRLSALAGVPCILCNDFAAQAHACVTAAGQNAQPIIREPKGTVTGTSRGVIGAGTGLGMALLVAEPAAEGSATPRHWRALPSEGGHAAFPFVGEEEFAFARYVSSELKTAFVTAEQVLCGQGLSRLHHFLTGERLTPPEVGRLALQKESETLEWYARFYGRACHAWLMSSLCCGGLWIAGGIAASNPLCVTHRAFANAYLAHATGPDIAGKTPVFLMADSMSGLWGAASLASAHC